MLHKQHLEIPMTSKLLVKVRKSFKPVWEKIKLTSRLGFRKKCRKQHAKNNGDNGEQLKDDKKYESQIECFEKSDRHHDYWYNQVE